MYYILLNGKKRPVEILKREIVGEGLIQVKMLGCDRIAGVKIFVSNYQIMKEDIIPQGVTHSLLKVS